MTSSANGSHRRLVLIDFDWQDADLLPELLRMPGINVRLVAGDGPDDAGVRVAELCGLPRSVELADLTREIFDEALVGERSPRRPQIERLLRALGTPVCSPATFVVGGNGVDRRESLDGTHDDHGSNGHAHGAEIPVHAEAIDGEIASADVGDPLALERMLADWTRRTSAFCAELHRLQDDRLVRIARSGPDDVLLESLVSTAHRVGTPQVVTRRSDPQEGALWGAWTLRGVRPETVLAVAGAESERSLEFWERAVRVVETAWSGAPPASARPLNLLESDAFARRIEMAIERHRADGYRFALHRLRFEAAPELVDTLVERLPERLRGTDGLCRVTPRELLLLCAGPTGAFLVVRARVQSIWEQVWTESGHAGRAPELADDRLEIAEPEDAHTFLTASRDWLARA